MNKFLVENLTSRHIRDSFDCGIDELNAFVKRYASQNQKKGLSKTYVAIKQGGDAEVFGYYTISAGSVEFQDIPKNLRKRLSQYYPIPVAHIRRLAIDKKVQGFGLGQFLLVDAFCRIAEAADILGIQAIEVRAKNDQAKSFYRKYGFTAMLDDARHLYIPLATVRKALQNR